MAESNSRYWYMNAVFYECYIRAFCDSNADGHGDLMGLIKKLDYFKDLGVDCIWLMPINKSPLKDDGYDVSDYFRILPEYGSVDDFRKLIEEAHIRDLKVIMDLVLNHTSDQHPWFQAARADRTSPYRDYYVWSDTDKKYSDARVIFVDSLDSNWTWDEKADQYYWHRFYPSQPDLNFDNHEVQEEMLRIVHFWLEMGVDGFRVDAVPYLFEREGTNCENLPETHVYLKRLRAYVDEHFQGRVLLCEANQWPEDVRPYFGNSDEFHMGFHFPLMPRIFMALEQGDRTPLQWVLEQTPEIPGDCQWCLFLRNHDELTLEMVSENERDWMWQRYAPDPGMRLNLGIRRRLAPLLDNDIRKIKLAYALIFSLPGTPIIYYGDEIGMGDDIYLPDRDGVRTPMQWKNSLTAGFSEGSTEDFYAPIIHSGEFGAANVNLQDQQRDPNSLWSFIQRLIFIRKSYSIFGTRNFRWIETGSQALAAYLRDDETKKLLMVHNLSAIPQSAQIPIPGMIAAINLFTENPVPVRSGGAIDVELQAYEFRWLEILENVIKPNVTME